ncbi:MAG TPA: restriction endonuclease subunit S, partial [bacterium]|nr:restriction endonuclease subunit S [bacterium]
WAVLRSYYLLKQWEYELTGSSRMRIGPNEIKNTVIPIPDLELQKEIVDNIKSKIAESDKEIQESKRLLEKAGNLFDELVFG